jgi:hypothetical protein
MDKTRRWGKANSSGERLSISNRFSGIAPAWFYSLMGNFLEHKEKSSLWSGHIGSTLLARMLVTLAVIVESSVGDPATDVMATDLFELAWSFHDAEIAELRGCVLTAVSCCIASVRQETLVRMLLSNTSSIADSLPTFLQHTAMSDPDENCRTLAIGISKSVAGLIDQY